ncbi:MAG: gluconokinase [Actinomycetota bacterium]|nr:gluconokinase [Actinomycetota bacterium]
MSTPAPTPRAVVVAGVSGSGKSTVGRSLAQRLDYDFADADDLHSRANIDKMRSGHPLTDEDRVPWLNAVGACVRESLDHGRGIVVACSALKRSYRDILRSYEPTTFFLLLDASPELIMSRVLAREGSFMPPSLLSSQFATLEALGRDEVGARVDVSHELTRSVDDAVVAVTTHTPGP